jgi:hypothetical protein
VVWESVGSVGSDNGEGRSIQAQRYASDGSELGGQFQVNAYTTMDQRFPRMAAGPGGDFVVVWQSRGSSGPDNDSDSIQGQRYASDGTALGAQFQVNSFSGSFQRYPSAAIGPADVFLVAWQSFGSNGSDIGSNSIQGQRYALDGTALGAEFQVNTYTTSGQALASVSAGPGGAFVVSWQSDGSAESDTAGYSVHAQRFSGPTPIPPTGTPTPTATQTRTATQTSTPSVTSTSTPTSTGATPAVTSTHTPTSTGATPTVTGTPPPSLVGTDPWGAAGPLLLLSLLGVLVLSLGRGRLGRSAV